MCGKDISDRYETALNAFVDKLRPDPNVIAVIVCGSLSNDVVWEKSDMDLSVIVRDVKMDTRSFCIEEDGIIINVDLMKIFDFKRMIGKSQGGGFTHSLFSKARIVYTTDDSIEEFLSEHKKIGTDDRMLSFFQMSSWLIGFMEKIEKWLVVKKDNQYARFWLLKSADIYANMLLILNNQPTSREAVLKIKESEPDKLAIPYNRPLDGDMTAQEIYLAVDYLRDFLYTNIDFLSKPVLAYMSDGAIRTLTTLTKHFGLSSHEIYHIFDFLAEHGVVCRVSETVKLTPKSRAAVEEVSFMCVRNWEINLRQTVNRKEFEW